MISTKQINDLSQPANGWFHMIHPDDRNRADIAISGASYAGLSLALALAEALPGIELALIDPLAPRGSGEPARDSRAFAVSASSSTTEST